MLSRVIHDRVGTLPTCSHYSVDTPKQPEEDSTAVEYWSLMAFQGNTVPERFPLLHAVHGDIGMLSANLLGWIQRKLLLVSLRP